MQKTDFFKDARNDLGGPLHGIRVLEATTSWAGPMCGCLLADLGADVIKVEAVDGEVARKLPPYLTGERGRISFLHATVNRNKRSLTLDLRRDEGRQIFLKLAARADVIVQNFRPGTFDKWGIGYEHCRQIKADIVYVSISGFGQFGPKSDRVGYDPLAEAESGFMSLNGAPDGAPTRCATYLCDDLAGLHGALSAVAALRHRDLTGEGQHIDVALLDAVLFQSNGFLSLAALGHPLPRLGNQSMLSAPVEVFDCCDGQIYVTVLLDSHWRVLCGMLGHAELADDARFATATARLQHRDECNRLLRDWLQPQTVAEAIERFNHASIPAAPVRTYHQAALDPHVREREMLQETEQEDGRNAPITGPAAKFSRTPIRVRQRAAALGEHSDQILAELGFDDAARERLRSMKVI
ncbi:MAG: CoA transferase [Deltaproteobacteria bacterium]|nr:CoA transferase [Deltaproteobacteria bacterium]